MDGWGMGSSYMYSRIAPSIPSMPGRDSFGCAVVGRLVGAFVLLALGYALFVFGIAPNARGMGQMFDPEGVRIYAQGQVNSSRIQEYLKHVSSYDHMAGTKGSQYLAKWMQKKFWEGGMDKARLDK